MAGKARSTKEAQVRMARELRAKGRTWSEIADTFQAEYGVNARVAMRLARGWTQADTATRWSDRWPDDSKTFKSISYWEQWPNATGHAPSLEVLGRLAELYGCHTADLIRDFGDHRHQDPMVATRAEIGNLPSVIRLPGIENGDPREKREGSDARLAQFVERIQNGDVNEIAQAAAVWAHQPDDNIDRRSLLLKVSYALTLAATASPTSIEHPQGSSPDQNSPVDLSGIWRSEYSYFSSGRNTSLSDTHYVTITQEGKQLEIVGLPHPTGSEIALNLTLDGLFATGTWQENTSPTGYYKGAIYRGAIQLLVSPTLCELAGKWVGFGKNFSINNGDWSFTLETRSVNAKARKEYALKS